MKLYRLDGTYIGKATQGYPAKFSGMSENSIGSKFWYMNGKRHRLNGAAIEWAGGKSKEYFVYGKPTSYEGYKLFISIIKLKQLV